MGASPEGGTSISLCWNAICIKRSHLCHLILMPTSFCCSVSFSVSLVSYASVASQILARGFSQATGARSRFFACGLFIAFSNARGRKLWLG
jgi:hypothetical protein